MCSIERHASAAAEALGDHAGAVVVPGGLGRLFLDRALGPNSGCELLAGAERGEAGVDFLLVTAARLEWFRAGVPGLLVPPCDPASAAYSPPRTVATATTC